VVGRLRISDIDQDGFPDFVMTLSFKDETNQDATKSLTRSVILLNNGEANGKRSMTAVN